jgi:hypothetical protein
MIFRMKKSADGECGRDIGRQRAPASVGEAWRGKKKEAGHYSGLSTTLFKIFFAGALLPTPKVYQTGDFPHVTSAGDKLNRDYVFHGCRFIQKTNVYAGGSAVFCFGCF